MLRSELEHHSQICRYLECDHCGRQIKRKRYQRHINECPEVTVDCIYDEFGCPAIFKRKDAKMHMEDCLAIHLELVKSSHKDLSNKVNKLESKLKE